MSRCGRSPPRPTTRRAASRRAWRKRIAQVDAAPAAIGYFGHGTTVATNALIQHRGVKTGLITTDGFRDLLEIGRQKRPDLYDLQADKPPVLVSRDLRLEVPERVRHDGSVEVPLDEAAFRVAVRRLARCGRAGGRRLLPVWLRPHGARGNRRPHPGGGLPRGVRLRVAPGRARVPRIRADVHRGGERLSRPGDAGLHPPPGRSARGAWHARDAASDAIQRRRHRLRSGGAAAGAHGPVGAIDRRGGRAGGRPAGWLLRPDHLRHGRHLHRRCVAARRTVPDGERGGGARLSDQGADAGHPHRRCRWRLDRVRRFRRAAEGRARAVPAPIPGRSATRAATRNQR